MIAPIAAVDAVLLAAGHSPVGRDWLCLSHRHPTPELAAAHIIHTRAEDAWFAAQRREFDALVAAQKAEEAGWEAAAEYDAIEACEPETPLVWWWLEQPAMKEAA